MSAVLRDNSHRLIALVAVLAVVLVVPAVASAQGGPSGVEYNSADQLVVGAAQSGDNGGGNNGGGETSSLNEPVVSSLPFTGVDVLAMTLAALVITGGGFALRRLSRPPEQL